MRLGHEPTYSSKGSKRYRYYVCSQAQKRGWDHCPTQSIPAGQIERIVLAQISKVGQDSERLQKTLTEASRQRHKGKVLLCIYQLEEDTFTLCEASPGVERPQDFSAAAGSQRILKVYKREKP